MLRHVLGSMALALAACSSSSSPTDAARETPVDACNPTTPTAHTNVVGGHVASVPEASAVVLFGGCTATRVGPRQMLTAAHCMYLTGGQLDASLKPGQTVQYLPASALKGARLDLSSPDLQTALKEGVVDSLDVHPSYAAAASDDAPNATGADVAVFTFHDCLDASVAIWKVSSRTVAARTPVTSKAADAKPKGTTRRKRTSS